MKKIGICAVAIFALMGCAPTVTRHEQMPSPGIQPTAAQAEEVVKKYLLTTLKDPDSGTSEPKRTFWLCRWESMSAPM